MRIGLAFALLALVILTAVGALAGRQARAELERSSGLLLAQVAARVAVALDTSVQERRREIANLALLDSMLEEELSPDNWRLLVDRMQSSFPHYSWVGVANAKGQVLAGTRRLLEGRDVSQRPWFLGGAAGQFMGDVHEALLLQSLLPPTPAGEPLRLVDFAAPLARGGQVRGVLGAHLSLAWAEERRQQALRSVPADRKMEILVLDKRGQVLLGPSQPAPPPLQQVAAPGLVTWGGGSRFLSATAAADLVSDVGLGWSVLVREPEDVAMAGAYQLERDIWALGLAGALVSGVVGWWLAGLLTQPLRDVAQRAQLFSVAAGRPHEQPRDEVAQLDESLRALVDELRRRESQLLQLNQGLETRIAERTQALNDANTDLRSFMRSVAHDVKGPIGAVAMVLRNLLRQKNEPLDVSVPRVVPMLVSECDRLNALVDELMVLSSVDEREMQRETVVMDELVAAVMEDLRRSGAVAAQAQVLLQPLPVVQGDAVLLRQVWQNLLSNAFRYSARQPVPQVQVQVGREGDEWLFSVQDNGVGFDMAQADRLFRAFQRLHRNSEFPGNGVGLTIVKRVVVRHGGRVGAESQPGQGARFFFFTLPADDPPPTGV